MKQLGLKQFSELTAILFSTALNSSRWQDFVTGLSTHTSPVNTHLYGYDMATNFTLQPLQHGYEPDFMQSYVNHYGAINAWAPGLARATVGRALTSAQTFPEEELFKTEFYNDWIRPQGDIKSGAGVVLANENGRFFVLGGNMKERHAHNEQTWLRTLTLLAPHMQHALEIARVVFAGSIGAMAAERLDASSSSAVFAVDAQRRIIFANAPAQAHVESGVVVGHSALGRLMFHDRDIDHAFSGAASRLGRPPPHPAARLLCPDRNGGQWTVRLAVIEGRELAISPPGFKDYADEPLMLVALSRDELPSDRSQAMRTRFGLTTSEAEVALGLGSGLTLREIADHRGTSLHTVRDQLKAALGKTGTRRQVELVRIIEQQTKRRAEPID